MVDRELHEHDNLDVYFENKKLQKFYRFLFFRRFLRCIRFVVNWNAQIQFESCNFGLATEHAY